LKTIFSVKKCFKEIFKEKLGLAELHKFFLLIKIFVLLFSWIEIAAQRNKKESPNACSQAKSKYLQR
jgi:hypothetical protein